MLQPEQILQDRYKLHQALGLNPVRQTWLAEDLTTQQQVIVKLLAFGGGVQWDELKLFEREAQILKQLDHPRITKYRDYFSLDDSSHWFGLVKDYIPGQSFKQLLDQGKRFTEAEIYRIGKEILEVLVYLHGLNPQVLHRDVKPSNLILGEDQQVYLVDFGAVQDKAASEGATFTVVGTYGYASMEQFGGRAVAASDLYALGATLIHLLTGTSPAELPTRNLKLQWRDRVSIAPTLAQWLEKLVEPALEKRFQRANEALHALEHRENKNQLLTPGFQALAHLNGLPSDSKIQFDKTDLHLKIHAFSGLSNWQMKHPEFLYISTAILLVFSYLLRPYSLILLAIIFSVIGTKGINRFAMGTNLEFYVNQYKVEKSFLGITYSREIGKTSLISEVVLDYQPIVSSNTQGYGVTGISIVSTTNSLGTLFTKETVGKGLTDRELTWMLHEIQEWLALKSD